MAKKDAIKIIEKGKNCGKGWTLVEIRVGKVSRRACIRGKVSKTPEAVARILDGVLLVGTVIKDLQS